jgi:hypothetical protein
MDTEKPTPPPGFKLLKGGELKAPFDPKLMVWADVCEWDDSCYAGSSKTQIDECDLDSWYSIPDVKVTTPIDCPQSLLSEAQKIIEERGKDYGDINQSFERIAKFWSAYKGVEITPHEVADMMILLKISRNVTSRKPDNLVDIIGYAECAGRLK